VFDERADLPFEIAGQVKIVEQDSVLQGLVPALNLSLGLRVIRCPTHMLDVETSKRNIVLSRFDAEPIGRRHRER
jgi:hypothetical protein